MVRVVGSLDLNSIAGSTAGTSVVPGSVTTGSVATGSDGASVGFSTGTAGAGWGWQAEKIMPAAKRTAISTYNLRIAFLLLERNIYFLI